VLRICFVCSGNICRSPTAEVVLRAKVRAAGLEDVVELDSAGIGDWHVGEDMDHRSRATLAAAGYEAAAHSAQQFVPAMFDERDLVVALDRGHRDDLRRLAASASDPASARAKVVLLREFDDALRPGEDPSVADPYYGGADGFAEVLEQIERSCAGLLAQLETGTAPT
jgi:protein-tyrosine phosphatase